MLKKQPLENAIVPYPTQKKRRKVRRKKKLMIEEAVARNRGESAKPAVEIFAQN